MLDSSAGSAATLEQDGVSTGRAAESELIERDAFTTSLENTSTGSLSEVESTNLEGGDFHHADIVSNRTDNNSNLAFLTLHVSSESIQTHGRAVDSAHVKTSKNDSGELGSSTSSDEAVKLRNEHFAHKQLTLTKRAR